MRRFRAIFKKEFRQIRRDPLSLGLLIVVPAMLLVLYGYALSFDVKHIRMGVLDEDNTTESRALLDGLFRNPYFDRQFALQRREDADPLLSRGHVRAVMIIPRGYARQIEQRETATVQVLVDAGDANTAATAIGYVEVFAERTTRALRVDVLKEAGMTPQSPAVLVEPRIWFNPELVSARFLVPGLIGLLLMLSAVIATSLSIVREKEQETMEQIMVSPVKPEELILGKTLPYILIGLVTMSMILLLGRVLFGVVVQGSYVLLALTSLLFLFAALGMGVLISSVTRSQQMAFQIAVIASLLPSIILSGFIFPIANFPLPIKAITLAVPPRYFVTALREIILKGAAFDVVWPQLAALLALGVAFNVLAAWSTRKTV